MLVCEKIKNVRKIVQPPITTHRMKWTKKETKSTWFCYRKFLLGGKKIAQAIDVVDGDWELKSKKTFLPENSRKCLSPFFLNSYVTCLRRSKVTRDNHYDQSISREEKSWKRPANFSELIISRWILLFSSALLNHVHSNMQPKHMLEWKLNCYWKGPIHNIAQHHEGKLQRNWLRLTMFRITLALSINSRWVFSIAKYPKCSNSVYVSWWKKKMMLGEKFSGRC